MIHPPRTILLRIAAFMLVTTAVCQGQNFLTRHVRPSTTNGQAPAIGRLPATQTMRLVVALPLRNQAGLDSMLADLYNPNSSSYHHFLTVDQFTAQFGPTQQDYDTTIAYLKQYGLTVVGTSRNRVNIDVSGTVANIEKAFHVTMRVYPSTHIRHVECLLNVADRPTYIDVHPVAEIVQNFRRYTRFRLLQTKFAS